MPALSNHVNSYMTPRFGLPARRDSGSAGFGSSSTCPTHGQHSDGSLPGCFVELWAVSMGPHLLTWIAASATLDLTRFKFQIWLSSTLASGMCCHFDKVVSNLRRLIVGCWRLGLLRVLLCSPCGTALAASFSSGDGSLEMG
jgi:hypothetical protein